MLLLSYKNFDNLFLDINKNIIENPDRFIEVINGLQCYMPFTIIECDSSDHNINLSELCYTASKIKSLSKSYIDKENLERFKNHLRECKGTSITYYFNNVKNKQGSRGNNGPCIISMVFTKKYRKDKFFNEVNIYYRSTEISRRFYADLVLFDLFIKSLPDDLIKIEKYRIILPKGFFHTKNCIFNLDLFKADLSKDNPVVKQIKGHLLKFDKHGLYTYKCVNRMQKKLSGERTWEKVNMKELSL